MDVSPEYGVTVGTWYELGTRRVLRQGAITAEDGVISDRAYDYDDAGSVVDVC